MLSFKRITVLLCAFWLFQSVGLFGQQEGVSLPFIILKAKSRAVEKQPDKVMPLPAGHTVLLDDSIMEKGRWVIKGKCFNWRLGFHVPEAPEMSVYIKNLNLSESDTLLVFTPSTEDRPEIITSDGNDVYYGTGFLPGDSLIVMLHTQQKTTPFEIVEIGIADRATFGSEREFGSADGCEVLVNCEEGRMWQNQKDGVARVLLKVSTNLFWCSGSLVNNTNNDGKPFFLMANHCGKDADDLDYLAWVFYFNYEGEGCEFPLTEPGRTHKVVGARLLAHSYFDADRASDFKLLLLNRDVPEEYHPYYNGWDRSGNVSASGVTIHHPKGDIKMISTYTNPVIPADFYTGHGEENGMYWQVTWSETENGYGVTEGGSSGSPLFDAEGHIIGTLTGGSSFCSDPGAPDYYGRFSHAWESEGTDSTYQLKCWLDPMNSGTLVLNGTNLDTTIVRANFSCDETNIPIGNQVQFVNYSTGHVTGFEWYFEGGEPSYSEEEVPPPVRYDDLGSYGVTLVARSTHGNDTLIIPAYIKVLPVMVPNPSIKGVFQLSFGKEIPANMEIRVYDLFGRNVSPVLLREQDGSVYVDISTQAAGIYLISVSSDNGTLMLRAFYDKRNL